MSGNIGVVGSGVVCDGVTVVFEGSLWSRKDKRNVHWNLLLLYLLVEYVRWKEVGTQSEYMFFFVVWNRAAYVISAPF